MRLITNHSSLITRLSTWLASALLTASLLGVFAVVGHIERWGVEWDDARGEAEPTAANCKLKTANCDVHRLTVDIAGCTPPRWISVTPIVEVVIESTSDLGWTAIGCTRFAHARAAPIPTKRVIAPDDGNCQLPTANCQLARSAP